MWALYARYLLRLLHRYVEDDGMLLPKTMIVEQLRSRGDFEAAERADRELAENVDTDHDAKVLD